MSSDINRKAFDVADLATLFKAVAAGRMNPVFEPIDIDRLEKYAARFHVSLELAALVAAARSRSESRRILAFNRS